MLLWLGFSVLTAAVVIALVRPLVADRAAPLDPAAADMAVYRDQIAEIVADRERGLIGAAEAEAAHAEVARRLLAREREATSDKGTTAAWLLPSARAVAAAVAALIPLGAIGIYLPLGSPGLPATSHEARLNVPAESASIDELVAKVEARLREKPDDGQGWDVLAPVYLSLERHAEAANAYARAIALLGESPKRLAGLAEAHVLAGNGMVNEIARLAYERLKALEPGRMEPRFWLALAKEQDGRLEAAAADYRALIAEAPADAPWRALVEARLKEVTDRAAGVATAAGATPSAATAAPAPTTPPPPERGASGGPRVEDIEAASRMTPDQRTAMIERMVDGLASRLKENGKDVGGWVKLVRAYSVMGRRGEAVAALAQARSSLAGDVAALAEIDALAKSLGLES